MKNTKKIITLFFLVLLVLGYAQEPKFPVWGDISDYERELTIYEKDSTAHAVVLNEVGYASVEDGGEYKIVIKNYVRIKILDKEGFDYATIKLRVYKKNEIRKVKASTTNFVNGKAVVTTLDKSQLFKEKTSENYVTTSFTFPDIQVGSIIEYSYILRTPYRYNFGNGWTYQNSIPTIKSTYYAKIPGFWDYHIATRGIENPKFQQSRLMSNCITINHTVAECLFLELTLYGIPAFIEEDYMTSTSNFLKRIIFELRTFTNVDGRVTHLNKSWKDTDRRLFIDEEFGRKYNANRYIKKQLPTKLIEEENQLKKAKEIYSFIQNHYKWNNKYNLFGGIDSKKAFISKEGSMVEINLALIHALKASGIDADIGLLSTRQNGFVSKIYPVTSDFNYLVAHIKIDGNDYFLDATDKNLSFGILPYRCLNGDIRIFSKGKSSYWYDFKPIEKNGSVVYTKGDVLNNGTLAIKTRVLYKGYSDIDKREEIKDISVGNYKEKMANTYEDFNLENHTIDNLENIDKPLIETFDFNYETDFSGDNKIYFKPFIIKDFNSNPFTLKERKYPVDLGYKREYKYNIVFTVPENYLIVSIPESRRVLLPFNEGGLLYLIERDKNNIKINFTFSLNKIKYFPNEYNSLKELFSQLIIAQDEMIILQKKSTKQ